MQNPFHYRNGQLFCEDVDIEKFAAGVATPFFLYSQAEIEYNCDQVWQAAGTRDFQPYYAVKANYNPAILKVILNKNFGADIVSAGELYFSQKAGFKADKIVFSGAGKTDQELELAITSGIHSINVESEAELLRIAYLSEKHKVLQRIAIRVNPDIEAQTHVYITTGLHSSKFGVSTEEAFNLYMASKKYSYIIADGIHVHIGSQITRQNPFIETAAFLVKFIEKLKVNGLEIKYMDLGGGIGIDYENDFSDPKKPRTYIKEILSNYLKPLPEKKFYFMVELGRSIIGSAGILVTKVILNKETPAKKFIIIDAAMNNLIRPSLYQASHAIIPVKKTNAPVLKADIVGPVCESGDFMAKDKIIQAAESGALLAIANSGAYGQSLSSNYNLRPTLAEYMVKGRDVSCIFKGNSISQIASYYEW